MFKKLVFASLAVLLAILACSVPGRSGGIIQGVVYADFNRDGLLDTSEQQARVEGATITLSDCGPTQTQTTDAEGKFVFFDVPAGVCKVSVSKSGWEYVGSFPALETYPLPVISDPNLPTAFSIYLAPITTSIPTATAMTSATPEPTFTLGPAMVTPTTNDVHCRFGPGTEYAVVGTLRLGERVPILATVIGRGWWKIENPRLAKTFCWVAASVTSASGNLAGVQEVPSPSGLVTEASIRVVGGPIIHGYCGGPNPVDFEVSITTNGPAKVIYRLEIYNADGSLRNATADATLTFTSYDTKVFNPGGAYKTDCGNFYVKLVISAPNEKTAQYDWSVVYP